jgi:hypothetical protein
LSALTTLLTAAPVAFLVGCVVGFIASNRWKIIRRNGGPH